MIFRFLVSEKNENYLKIIWLNNRGRKLEERGIAVTITELNSYTVDKIIEI